MTDFPYFYGLQPRWTASNAGTVTLHLRNGTIRRFILIGNQDLAQVRGLIGQVVADVTMAG